LETKLQSLVPTVPAFLPGKFYTLRSRSTNGYLNGRAPQYYDIVYVSTNRDQTTLQFFQWEIIRNGASYVLKSRSSQNYLDGRSKTGEEVYVTNRNLNDNCFQWQLTQLNNGYYTLKSLSSNSYLDGRTSFKDGIWIEALVRNGDAEHDISLQWIITLDG